MTVDPRNTLVRSLVASLGASLLVMLVAGYGLFRHLGLYAIFIGLLGLYALFRILSTFGRMRRDVIYADLGPQYTEPIREDLTVAGVRR